MIKKYLFIRNHDAHSAGGGAILTETKLVGQATDAEIKSWKETYRQGIYAVEMEGHIGYFQNPNRMHMNVAMSKANADAALDMYEMLAKLTKIGGSEALLTDDELFYGLSKHLKVKMDGKKGNPGKPLRDYEKRSARNPMGLYDTMISYYTSKDPDKLDDEEWLNVLAHIAVIRKMEARK